MQNRWDIAALVAWIALGAVAANAQVSSSASSASSGKGSVSASASRDGTRATSSGTDDCRTVYLKPGERPPLTSSTSADGVTSSVSAGGGAVSGSTSTAGGGVTSRSGPGASSSASSSSDGRTVITKSDGTCITYIEPGRKD